MLFVFFEGSTTTSPDPVSCIMRLSFLVTLFVLAASAGTASAEGVALFGNARLGLGHNILNNGQPDLEAKSSVAVTEIVDGVETTREVVTRRGGVGDLRALSRVRFGVIMTGESDSGVAFGATIRADNAPSGDGAATNGQLAGNVFVTGDWGTLTYGDTDGADFQRTGVPIGNGSLTGLGDFDQLPFFSNGGGSDNGALQFVTDPEALPTVRYDYDAKTFGVSVSTNRTLDDVAVGAAWHYRFEGGSIDLGGGYNDFSAFTGFVADYGRVDVPAGDQWAAQISARYAGFRALAGYTSIDAGAAGKLDVLTLGGSATFGALQAFAYYATVTDGDALFGAALDGRDSYGASALYDLGGGVRLNAGVARTYGVDAVGTPGEAFAAEVEPSTLADFGISLTF